MGEWAPVVGGFGFLALVFVAARHLPHDWLAADLSRWYGVRPRGAYQTFTRTDQLRRMLSCVAAGVALLGVDIALYAVVPRATPGSNGDLIFQAYTFILAILAGVAALAALQALVQALFWRPRRIRLTADGRDNFAQYLEFVADGELPDGYWRDFSAVRFEGDEAAEAVRAALSERLGATPRDVSEADATMLRGWVQSLR